MLLSSLFLFGCQTTNSVPQLQNFLPNTQANSVRVDDFVVTAKWCSIAPDRTAECEFEMTSLYQDKKAGIAYPTIQDQTGKEYRMQTKDGSVGGKVMVAGQPYTEYFVAQNLPTYSTQVRSIVGTFVIWDLRGIRIGSKPVTFSNIPVRPSSSPVAAASDTVVEKPQTAPSSSPSSKGSLVDSYWHGVIVPVVNVEDNDIIRLWRHGAYMHFRADGIAGYNWSEPKNYDYNKVNVWRQDGNTFTLTMSGAVYTFELRDDQAPLVAYLQPGGAFKMTMKRQ